MLLEKDELIIKNAELAEKYSLLKTVNSKVVNGEVATINLKHRTVRLFPLKPQLSIELIMFFFLHYFQVRIGPGNNFAFKSR